MALYHDFWFLREGEHPYTDYPHLLSQHNAPVRVNDDLLRYFSDTLSWIPTLNPAKESMPMGYGLNWYGPTIMNQAGGARFQRVCTAWAQLFACGPEQLKLRVGFSWQWPFEESERLVSEDQLHTFGRYEYLEIDRDQLVRMLTTLAQFGEQASRSEFYVLHLEI